MKKGKIMLKIFILLCTVGIFIVGCNSTDTTAPEPEDPALKPAKAVFEARCSQCHSISRPLGKHKTPAEWKETVTRMHNKAPGEISDTDVKKILAYLEAVRGSDK